MGNCLTPSSKIENAHSSTSDPCKASSKYGFSSQPASTTASSSNSTFTTSTGSQSTPTLPTGGDSMSNSCLKVFTFNELKSATRNFRPDSLIGEGGFGYVFKGWIDEQNFAPSKPGSGMLVAVKKLKPEGLQGHKEWLTEVHYLGQLHHPNLVKLIGYCEEGHNRLLVYEYMVKGCLENHLFRRRGQLLSWPLRINIAVGAARGLSFLHDAECQVIYRDLKSSNILLDTDFNPRLSDFGLAKAGPTGDRTHVSTRVVGTQGYAAPEYIATGRLSTKADVYSFGVVLLELLSGRRAVDPSKFGTEQSLVEWATPYLVDKRKLFRIIDTRLEGQYSNSGAHAVAKLALRCLDDDAKLRPRMSEVLETLERLWDQKETTGLTRAPPRNGTSARTRTLPTRRPRSPLHPSPSAAGSQLPS